MNFLNNLFLGNRIIDYLIFVAILIGGFVLIGFFRTRLCKKLKQWSTRTESGLDDFLSGMLEQRLVPLLYFVLLYVSLQTLTLSRSIGRIVDVAGLVILMFLGVRLLMDVVVYVLENVWVRKEEDNSRRQAFKGIISFVKLMIWGLAIVLLLDNLGVKVSALMAGLGIGGIAVALAAQAVLGDLFSYFTIFFDRPFETGDFIMIGDLVGTVEHIGIKTTRLRSISGEQVIFSNTDLTNSRVRNYKRMERRRVVFNVGVDYQTKLELLKDIPGMIQEIVKATPEVVFDRAHLAVYGSKGFIYEVVYYVIGSDYTKYMDIQQNINFCLMDAFQKRGISLASPT